jgi:uncharacterized protein (TIGR00369 family)
MDIAVPETLAEWNAAGSDYLPGLIGMVFEKVEVDEVVASFDVRTGVKAWNGFLHAGAVVSMADTCCGYGTVRSLPEGSAGFTTVELKSNFIGTAREGTVRCVARPVHRGRTTQVWDAVVEPAGGGKALAHFRCTQMILWPRGGA